MMARSAELNLAVRSMQNVAEMRIGVDLQRKVWGYSETDVVPEHIFVVAKENGGQVLLAFHDELPIGFALSFAGIHNSKICLHSHMVAVLPEYQNAGVGRLIKLAQRDDALARGIGLIKWTFDPLQLKNAYFNLAKLGAIVRHYIPDLYGRTSSPLHAGLPTDRLLAEWFLNSPHVQRALAGRQHVPGKNSVRIAIPAAIRSICAEDPAAAEKIQLEVREQFNKNICAGYAAVGFEFDADQGKYILENYED